MNPDLPHAASVSPAATTPDPLAPSPSKIAARKQANIDLYTDLRYEFDKLDRLFSRSINPNKPLSSPLVTLRRKIRLARVYEVIKEDNDSSTGAAFRALAAHAYRYFELIIKLEQAKYLTRENAQKMAIRTGRILELTDPKVTRLFGVID